MSLYQEDNMSLYYLDYCKQHDAVIRKFLMTIIEKKFDNESNISRMSCDAWIDSCIDDAFNEWKKGGPNFEKWLNFHDTQLFETPRMFEQLILYNNKFFERKSNINWAYQTPDFKPETVINTYASCYAQTDSFNTINNAIIDKTLELIEQQEKKEN
jgi:hypothetical protein